MGFIDRYYFENRKRCLFYIFLGIIFCILVFLFSVFLGFITDKIDIFLFLFVGLSIFIYGVYELYLLNYCVKGLSEQESVLIDFEMSDSSSVYYKCMHICLTHNYVIVIKKKFIFYKYCDFFWIYTYYLKSVNSIKVFMKDGSSSILTRLSYGNRIQRGYFDNIIKTIKEKNPDVLIGFSSENFNAFKKMVKQKKKV